MASCWQFWHQTPVSANNAPYQPLMAQVIEAAFFPIALARGVNEREVSRFIDCRDIFRQKLRFEYDGNFLCKADTDKTPCCNRVSVANETHRVLSGDYLSGIRRSKLCELGGGNS